MKSTERFAAGVNGAVLCGVLLCGGLWGCSDRAASRARLDEQVGQVDVGNTSFVVRDGLASVQRAVPGELVLWASAPVLEVDVRSDSPQSWSIDWHNVLPDARIQAFQAGVVLPLEQLEGERATHKRIVIDLPAGASRLRLTTADADDRGPWRFALLSDIQEGVDEVQDVFAAISAVPELRFVLGAGDLAITGRDDELQRVKQELQGLATPYYTTLGNHDVYDDSPWHVRFGRGNFRFRYRGVQFSLLDSAAATVDPLVYDWLGGWLEEARDDVHVVAMHIPPLDPVGSRNGAFGSRGEAGALLQQLAAGGVDLTLYGHIHSYYRFDNGGIPAFISGGGGARDEKLDGHDRHFVVVDIAADGGFLGSQMMRVDP